MTEPEQPKQSRLQRFLDSLDDRKDAHKQKGVPYRVGYMAVGVVVTVAGLVMLVTPGPAFVLIPLGLAMLSMEFAWAESALEKALLQADKASQAAKEADTKQKIAVAVAVVLIAAAAIGAIYYWDITVPVINPDD